MVYVRMRLLNHKNSEIFRKKNNNPLFKYYKLALWFFAFLYFLFSFSLPNKPTQSDAVPSHSLFDPITPDVRVFAYDLPPRFNADWLANERCSSHLFAAEVAIHRALLNDHVLRTLDPYEADFFFVPVYVSCNFSTVNGFTAIGHARSLLSSAVHLVSSSFPFWNRSSGSDHVFVASHDLGACFHAMEEKAKDNGIPEFLKNSIVILQTFGVNYDHQCQQVENVVIPPYVSPECIKKTLRRLVNGVAHKRDIFAFFRGKMEVHPKNVSGRFYSKKVRTVIWKKFNADRRFYLERHRFAGYLSEILLSVFCLCPLGSSPTGYGCRSRILCGGRIYN